MNGSFTAVANDITKKKLIAGCKFIVIYLTCLPLGKHDNWLFARWRDVSDFSWPMAGGRFLRKLLETFNFSSDKTFPIPRIKLKSKKSKEDQCL